MEQLVTHREVRPPPAKDRRWLLLVIVAIAQLMVVLDATIVNIALPSAQHALGFPNSDRQWVVTAYALAFGSLLLHCGRVGDPFSRKKVFITAGRWPRPLPRRTATRWRPLSPRPCSASALSWPSSCCRPSSGSANSGPRRANPPRPPP